MSRCSSHYQHLSATHAAGFAKTILNHFSIYFITIVLLTILSPSSTANPLPVLQEESPSSLTKLNQSSSTVESLLNENSSNTTENDLYVIRAVVYEIGILTDVDNSTNEATERHEEVNLSFYDPPHNDNGQLDLSGIPVPQVVAGTPNKT